MTHILPSAAEMISLLGGALIIYLLLILLARALRRWRDVRFRWVFHLFAIATGLLISLNWLLGEGSELTWRTDLTRHLTAAVTILAAFPITTLFVRVVWGRKPDTDLKAAGSRILIDTVRILTLILAVILALQFVYDIQVPGLVAGSGIMAIILGLAMQDLLGNLIAGVSLHFEKTFQPGDWLLINNTHAKVIELSWRSTLLLTNDDVLIDVPNTDITKQAITNFQLPTPRHAVKATISLHYDLPPLRAQRVLKAAAMSVPGVCLEPAPVVLLKDFLDSGISYEIKVWIEDHGLMNRVLSEVRSHAWYAAKREGFVMPYPQRVLHRAVRQDPSIQTRGVTAQALRSHELLDFLSEAEIDNLVRESPVQLFANTERIVTQGEAGESMFFLVRGHVEVSITRNGQQTIVAKLGPGDCFGEMSLLTGAERTATVVALDEVETVEIIKQVFASLVRNNPEILSRLSELLAQRQLANDQWTPDTASQTVEQVRFGLLGKLRELFAL